MSQIKVKIEQSWERVLSKEFEKLYFEKLSEFVHTEYKKTKVYPQPKEIFQAFNLCSFENVKVVILGQDPYHGVGQANGLSFAVHEKNPLPPSLQNIFKEIEADIGIAPEKNGDLSRWAKQGVLLLNSVLTVRASSPASHQGKGWEEFTDSAVFELSEKREHLVFILWGNYAKKKGAFIDRTKHLVIESPHPSPFSAYSGFFGSKPFSKTNKFLKEKGIGEIEWR